MAGDINLKRIEDPKQEGFAIHHIDDEEVKQMVEESEPGEMVKISFAKFANLVARSDIEDIIAANLREEIIIRANLLAELATPSEEEEERKIPVIFSIGLVVGIILTYILFKYL